mmetsp:Transcript_5199/g.9420  ORF Transcript_5199/g.9420 Transcript_5199/m.9420 type:complete len:390 (-) Transcript_5199:190-1359(-)
MTIPFTKQHKLHEAAKEGNVDKVIDTLSKGAFLDNKDSNGWNPIHKAVWHGHDGIVKVMVEHAMAIYAHDRERVAILLNEQAEHGWTPLHMATYKGFGDIATLLLEHGADARMVRKNDGRTCLHIASMNNHGYIVKCLLQNSQTNVDVNAKDPQGWTPLMYASACGYSKIVKLLLKHHADVNQVNNMKSTALHWAAERGNEDIAKLLIHHQASIQGLDKQMRAPISYAANNNHAGMVKILLDQNVMDVESLLCINALHEASSKGFIDVVKVLLEYGVPINGINQVKMTALHLAARNGHLALTKYLIEHGAKINAKTSNKFKPLDFAIASKHGEVVKLLLAKQAAKVESGTSRSSSSGSSRSSQTMDTQMVPAPVNINPMISAAQLQVAQ